MKKFAKLILPVLAIAFAASSCNKGYYSMPIAADMNFIRETGEENSQDPQFESIVENPFINVADEPVSTFSVDADGASYAYTRRCLRAGYAKTGYYFDPTAIRTEEFLNYFTFDYAEPTGDETVAINAETGPCPWNEEHRLLRLGLKGKSLADNDIPPANFIFLIDNSGSMYGEDRIDLVQSGLCKLVDNLRPDDRVAIITYGGHVKMLLESTLAKNANTIKKVIKSISADGSTPGGAAMKMAYDEAVAHYSASSNNRIIMCTDGDFNVGVSSTDELVEMVESYLDKGIYLSIMGFGLGNFQDSRMENMAAHGNGTYNYIDSEEEMMKVFVAERSNFYSVANDTKCQITFTDAVQSYRLIGYEHRVMNNEDFEDDTKDAGEIGAGQTVTALYEIIPSENWTPQSELATFDVRYKMALGEESRPLSLNVTVPLPAANNTTEFDFAAGVATFALKLRDSKYASEATFDMAYELVQKGIGKVDDPLGLRPELLELIKIAEKDLK